MSSEYIRLSMPESIYGEKNLLKAQIEMLKVIKSYEEYRRLRKEELALKILLKTSIGDAHEKVKFLESLLPKAKDPGLGHKEEKKEDPRSVKKRMTLEQEIYMIKKKLEALH